MQEKTITFSLSQEKDYKTKETLKLVHNSLEENGYNATNQIAGYILSEDPTYITTHGDARNLIQKIDRYELLKILIESYLNN